MSNIKIEPCPAAGNGVNAWVNHNVLRMLRAGFTNRTIYMRLIAFAQGCGRDIRKDITHSIETGRVYLGMGKGFGVKTKHDRELHTFDSMRDLPRLDPVYQQQVLDKNQHINLKDWLKPHERYDTMKVIHHLFGIKHRICIGYRQNHSCITHLTLLNEIPKFENQHIRLGLCQFIVPTPMIGEYALNKMGKRATRCMANTAERWFLVIEFDHLPSQDDQIRLHYELTLGKNRELRMLVFSGNKSIHGWYDVYRKPERVVKKLMKDATKLGADPMTWIPCQYVRFPGGVNSATKQKQEILYYNYGK